MKYLDEYRNERVARKLLDEIRRAQTRPWVIMEVCGGQTHSIVKQRHRSPAARGHRTGARARLPGLRHAAGDDRQGARHRRRPDVIFCSFGDMLRVPGSEGDLFTLKSRGADVRVVYSPLDCLKIARANPGQKVVFFAIGFETTAPGQRHGGLARPPSGVKNFSILVSHVLVPPAMSASCNRR